MIIIITMMAGHPITVLTDISKGDVSLLMYMTTATLRVCFSMNKVQQQWGLLSHRVAMVTA